MNTLSRAAPPGLFFLYQLSREVDHTERHARQRRFGQLDVKVAVVRIGGGIEEGLNTKKVLLGKNWAVTGTAVPSVKAAVKAKSQVFISISFWQNLGRADQGASTKYFFDRITGLTGSIHGGFATMCGPAGEAGIYPVNPVYPVKKIFCLHPLPIRTTRFSGTFFYCFTNFTVACTRPSTTICRKYRPAGRSSA